MEKNQILKEISTLEEALQKRIGVLKGGDEEESKEQGRLKARMQEIKSMIEHTVKKALILIQQKALALIDPLLPLNTQTDTISLKLQSLRDQWKNEKREITLKQKRIVFSQLEAIEEEIGKLERKNKEADIEMQQLIKFDEETLYKSLLSCIKVKEAEIPQETEDLLIFSQGFFDIKKGGKVVKNFEREFPDNYASFQFNKKLYVCGGSFFKEGSLNCLPNFFTINYLGKAEELTSLPKAKCSLSLCGYSSRLISVGGFDGKAVSSVEEYSILTRKWRVLPELNLPRYFSGSCLLESKQCFCFCGQPVPGRSVNVIEKIHIQNDQEWRVLPTIPLACTFQLATIVKNNDKIILFGGHHSASFNMYILSEDGEIEKDLSGLDNIPGSMCQGGLTEVEGKIYAVGARIEWDGEQRGVVFDGKEWKFI